MDKIKVLAYAYQFQEMFLSKDIFLIPYYIAKEQQGQCKYLYTYNLGKTPMPSSYRGVTIECTKNKNEWKVFVQEILLHARSIDVLFLTGSSAVHMMATFLYKQYNPKGKVVVFGDMEEPQAQELNQNEFNYSNGLIGWIKNKLTDYFFRHVTYLVANTEAYHLMVKLFQRKNWNGLIHFYPCFDNEKFESYGMIRKSFSEKENLMVCVGRIGCHQKNTEMLLRALKKVDLKNWKIYMLGPITSSFDLKEGNNFQKVIDNFFEECPQHNGKIIFTGMIYDQKVVFDFYNRAKVLLMTSRHESWGNVYSEAAALGCYILSTEVGGANLASNDWKFGYKLQQEDSEGLCKAINDIVNGKVFINDKKSMNYHDLCYSNLIYTKLLPKMGYTLKNLSSK